MSLDEMAAPCYCCPMLKLRNRELGNGHASMADLDTALNELGMLSTITSSRQDYLHEKSKSQPLSSCLPVPEMCVLQMNSDFVTNFTFFKAASSGAQTNYSRDGCVISSKDERCVGADIDDIDPAFASRCRRRSNKNHMHLYRPYEKHHPQKVKFARESCYRSPYAVKKYPDYPKPEVGDGGGGGSSGNSGTVTRQDSGGKSNPGSPVKSQKKVTNTGCSIPRSRSLDDLEISKLNLNECCGNEAGRTEIEIVSQRINNLHVS